MKTSAVIYIHGKGGSAAEVGHYAPLFPDCDVIGFDYQSETPWQAKEEFSRYYEMLSREYETIHIVGNSIGAYFAMQGMPTGAVKKAFFISPVVDMEHLITNMMHWNNVTEEELQKKGTIETDFGETLSWEYLSYTRNYPIIWKVPTWILYGENDDLTPFSVISEFAERTGAPLTVMRGGEHWFHTEEQMAFLDAWITGG